MGLWRLGPTKHWPLLELGGAGRSTGAERLSSGTAVGARGSAEVQAWAWLSPGE